MSTTAAVVIVSLTLWLRLSICPAFKIQALVLPHINSNFLIFIKISINSMPLEDNQSWCLKWSCIGCLWIY